MKEHKYICVTRGDEQNSQELVQLLNEGWVVLVATGFGAGGGGGFGVVGGVQYILVREA